MNKNSPEIIELKKQVEERIGRKIRTPKDFDFLRSHIWENNKEIISPTTLKRLWGYIGGADRARPGTLDILSRAAGFKDWDDFLGNLNPEGASDAIKAYHISTEALQAAFDAGATHAIAGSVAALKPQIFESWLSRYGARMILGADVRGGQIAVKGWQE